MHDLTILSHSGPYTVRFGSPFAGLEDGVPSNAHLVIDARVATLYQDALKRALPGALRIDATEQNKSLERMPDYALHLLEAGVRRGDTLVAVGGGVIQDIVCFLAATLLRGIPWRFYPTTLLAQADSCIGSKSSINVGRFKNQLGTFTPPADILISTDVLDTLSDVDLRSGLGEIIKVHVIQGGEDVTVLARDLPGLLSDRRLLARYIARSLAIKKALVERDEFDRGDRLVLNYGHTFGHAIESATRFAIPHGISVTIGMDLANFVAWRLGLLNRRWYDALHEMLVPNYGEFAQTPIPEQALFDALGRDKKNKGGDVTLVLPRGPGDLFLDRYRFDERMQSLCREFLAGLPSSAPSAAR